MPSIPLRRRSDGSTVRRGQPRNSATFFESSVFDAPGGPKKIADLGVSLSNLLPLTMLSASSERGLTNFSQRKSLNERPCWLGTSSLLSKKSGGGAKSSLFFLS